MILFANTIGLLKTA